MPDCATRLKIAASLGDATARAALPRQDWIDLDNAFDVFMATSETAESSISACAWTYPLEVAIRMALAVYRDFLADWRKCFRQQRERIPQHVPENFAPEIAARVTRWVLAPKDVSWDENSQTYDWIKEVCVDGYLLNDYPETPPVVDCCCMSAIYLMDIEKPGQFRREYDPDYITPAHFADAVDMFITNGFDEKRMRRAVKRELIPWCMGNADPLQS